MGYDININLYHIENGVAKYKMTVDEIYLSYNWSKFWNVCPVHSFGGEGICPADNNCEKVKLWYFRDDCDGRRGDDVKIRAEKALSILNDHGITAEQVNHSKDIGWGNGLNPIESLIAFAYHIDRFRQLGEKHSDCFFMGDSEYLTMPDETKVQLLVDV
jgi:hypothetical protein